MGVDVDPEVMIGILFEREDDAKQYISNAFGVEPEEYKDTLSELFISKRAPELDWQEISGYDNYGGVLGAHISPRHLDYRTNHIDEIWEELFSIFPQEDHSKIKTHIWARYW